MKDEMAPNPLIQEKNQILIKGINYSYSIEKSKNEEEESIKLKLFSPSKKSNFYFTYECPTSKIVKDIKFLAVCEETNEMIDYLKEIFVGGNAKVEEKEEKFYLELKIGIGKKEKKAVIELTKNEEEIIPKEPRDEILEKIEKLEKNYKILLEKFDNIKSMKENNENENNIKNIVKEVLFEQETKNKLFEEFETIFISKYKLEKIDNKEKNEKKLETQIIEKVKNIVDEKEKIINNKIIEKENEIKKDIQNLNDIKNKLSENQLRNNYIEMLVKIGEEDINKDIRLFGQAQIYKYICNFEPDDIETIIDGKNVSIKYKNIHKDFKYDEKSKNCEQAQSDGHTLNTEYYFYWNFDKSGEHTVKIIFKKKLISSEGLFYDCNNLYKIDCSNFDCSQVNNCSYMFYSCTSLIEINLGKLDFRLSTNFSYMFQYCADLENIDVSNFNTENAIIFRCMFSYCLKLKEINVSKFKTKLCQNIDGMFRECKSMESIDMLGWDTSNLQNIDFLFYNCSSLKKIKINLYNKKFKADRVFKGLPNGGSFVWRKGQNCDELLRDLPVSWNRTQE